jgi:ATP adenylyltransferase/5',5'''-P-1,P-4-tetraphosphate phosphorylase II
MYKKQFKKDSVEILDKIDKKKIETSLARKELGNVYSDYDEQKEIRQQNYQRNHCIFNKSKAQSKLDSFEEIVERNWDESFDDTIIEDLITESEE